MLQPKKERREHWECRYLAYFLEEGFVFYHIFTSSVPPNSNHISSCKLSIYFAQKNYFFYFTHQFLQNTHISLFILHIYSIKYSFFYNFLLFPHSLPLSLTYLTLLKNTKILNVRDTIIVHIYTVIVALVHLCTILHH